MADACDVTVPMDQISTIQDKLDGAEKADQACAAPAAAAAAEEEESGGRPAAI